MGALDKLNLVIAVKTTCKNPQQHRRNKLATKIDEQIKLATARLGGEGFTAKKLKRVFDNETGEVRTVETAKRVKEWWWYGDNGKLLLSVKYGSKVIAIAKVRIPRHSAMHSTLIRPPIPGVFGRAVGAKRRWFWEVTECWL